MQCSRACQSVCIICTSPVQRHGLSNRFHQFFLMVPIDFGNMTMATAIGFGFFVDYEKLWQHGAGLAPSAP